MDSRLERFYESLNGKTVAFCGIGRSHEEMIRIFCEKGAKVTVRDKRSREALGDTAAKLEGWGAQLILGEDYLQNLHEEMILRTPGMKFTLPELDAAREQGCAVTSEMELFFDLCPCKIYGVTGSDGKTTTTTVIAELLQNAGKTVHLGGNIGKPLFPRLETIRPEDVAVAELSSFQLISMRRSPDVAVVTNVSPNHLDMHKDMDEYVWAKMNVFLHQNAFGKAVFNEDNDITLSFVQEARGQALTFSRQKKVPNGAWVDDDGFICMNDTRVMRAEDIKIPGLHNLENYLAAIAAVWGDVPVEVIRKVATTFSGVAHRAELVRTLNGVAYYNDSIASSPTRTVKGMLSLFPQKIILIAGGYDKHIPYDSMGPEVVRKVKTLILMGATADKIEAAVKNAPDYRDGNPAIVRADSMKAAVALAEELSSAGDIVALSPASASFDMYTDFEARGNDFKRLVMALPG